MQCKHSLLACLELRKRCCWRSHLEHRLQGPDPLQITRSSAVCTRWRQRSSDHTVISSGGDTHYTGSFLRTADAVVLHLKVGATSRQDTANAGHQNTLGSGTSLARSLLTSHSIAILYSITVEYGAGISSWQVKMEIRLICNRSDNNNISKIFHVEEYKCLKWKG